jgi:hypothetical protein
MPLVLLCIKNNLCTIFYDQSICSVVLCGNQQKRKEKLDEKQVMSSINILFAYMTCMSTRTNLQLKCIGNRRLYYAYKRIYLTNKGLAHCCNLKFPSCKICFIISIHTWMNLLYDQSASRAVRTQKGPKLANLNSTRTPPLLKAMRQPPKCNHQHDSENHATICNLLVDSVPPFNKLQNWVW